MGTVSVLSVWLLFRFCVPVRGSGLWVSSVPGCESTRGGWAWVGRGEWLQGARAWQPPAGCSEPWAQCSQLISSSFYTSPNRLLETGQAKSSRESRDCTFRQLHSHLLRIGDFFCSLDALHSLASPTFFWLAHCQCCALSSSATSSLHKELWFWSLSNEPFEVKMSVRAW